MPSIIARRGHFASRLTSVGSAPASALRRERPAGRQFRGPSWRCSSLANCSPWPLRLAGLEPAEWQARPRRHPPSPSPASPRLTTPMRAVGRRDLDGGRYTLRQIVPSPALDQSQAAALKPEWEKSGGGGVTPTGRNG